MQITNKTMHNTIYYYKCASNPICLHVAAITKNLVAVRQILEQGIEVEFNPVDFLIKDKEHLIAVEGEKAPEYVI